ncbi:protein-glutamate methyltransferase, partial [Methylobacterium sp. WL120]
AWRLLRDALAVRPTDPALRLYEGLLALGFGREAEAERAFRGALYLDRGYVMAHYHLGLLLGSLGRTADARRALDNAVALSQALPPDAPLPEGDGACAGEIALSAAAIRDGIGTGAA